MGYSARRQYLMAVIERYNKSSKSGKSLILDEFCAVCGYHRKHAIRLLTKPMTIRTSRRGKKVFYGEDVEKHLVQLWLAMGRICAARVKAAIPEWIKYYNAKDCDEGTRLKLLMISSSSIERIIKPYRDRRKAFSLTKKSKWWYKTRVPIHNDDIKERRPGFFQADTVAHCGESVSGKFIHTLTLTDIGTTWAENIAIWTKQQQSITCAMNKIEDRLPIPIWAFKSDSGSEFLNF